MHREFFSICRGFVPLLHDEKCGGYGASRVAYYASQGAYHDGLAHDVDACYG